MKIELGIDLIEDGYFCLKLDSQIYHLAFVSTVMSMISNHISAQMMSLEQELEHKHINRYKQREEEKKSYEMGKNITNLQKHQQNNSLD